MRHQQADGRQRSNPMVDTNLDTSGKYLVSIKGFVRKQKLDFPNPNYGFLFSLVAVDEFESFNDPREDEIYYFNVANM